MNTSAVHCEFIPVPSDDFLKTFVPWDEAPSDKVLAQHGLRLGLSWGLESFLRGNSNSKEPLSESVPRMSEVDGSILSGVDDSV